MDNQKPSTSSFLQENSKEETTGKNKGGQKKKKLKKNSEPEPENQVEVEEECFMDKLPTEMLMKILKNVDTKSLVRSRRVNRNWNIIASELCESRRDLLIKFTCSKDKGKLVITEKAGIKTLVEFLECFSESKNFRCTHFQFRKVDVVALRNRTWTKFISTFGENIKCLKLKTRFNYNLKNLTNLAEKLRHLLLNQLPNLEEFGLMFDIGLFPQSISVPLFPATTTTPSKKTTAAAPAQLPRIKVLYLNENCCSIFPGIFADILRTAVNLEKIEPFRDYGRFGSIESIRFVQTQEKLDLLQDADISLSADFLSNIKETPALGSQFKLKTLDLNIKDVYKNPSTWSDASVFLTNLFESSKETLEKLKGDPLGFLLNLELPKFNKLTKLSIDKIKKPILPSGIELVDICPALHSLDLEISWNTAFPQEDFISAIPTLEILTVIRDEINAKSITQISVMCPNLKNFKIIGSLNHFPTKAVAIWTHLTKLECLDLEVDVDSKQNAYPAMDSCITGFLKKECRRLYNVAAANKLVKKYGYKVQIPTSEQFLPERKFPSILDLKDLKDLKICLISQDKKSGQALLKKAISSISEEYALKLMDNLSYKIKRWSRG